MFKLEFDTDSDAFTDEDGMGWSMQAEIKRILKRVSSQVEDGQTQGSIIDLNGNKVGTWTLTK